jgi:hypothetical protein
MKTKRSLLALAFFLAALPMYADFDAVVRKVSSHRGLRRVSIPFLGVARFAVWIIRPEGVHDFQLATFEGKAEIDGRDIGEAIEANAGPGFRPIVRVRSNRHGGEWTFVYARPMGSDFELMVATHDHGDTTVVRAVVDLDRLQRAVNNGRHGNVMASLR